MEKIWIIGSSGAGKSTLANIIGEKLNITVYNNDKVFWMENWKQRANDEQIEITKCICEKDKWIYEGNRFNHCKEDGRYEKCDTIIFLQINRFRCMYRFLKRYIKYRGTVRPDISDGCTEKIDIHIIKFIIVDYPKRLKMIKKLLKDAREDGKDVVILTGKNDVKKLIASM